MPSGSPSDPGDASESGVRSLRPLPGLFDDEEDGGAGALHEMATRPGDSLALAAPAYDERKTVHALEPIVDRGEPGSAADLPTVTATTSPPPFATPSSTRSRRNKVIAAVAMIGLSLGILARVLIPHGAREASQTPKPPSPNAATNAAATNAQPAATNAGTAGAASLDAPQAPAPSTPFESMTSSISTADRKAGVPRQGPIVSAPPPGHAAPGGPTSSKLDIAALGADDSAHRDLGDALREAAGSRTAAPAKQGEAAATSNAKMVKPAAGAVRAAIGNNLPAARACLDAAAQPVTVTLVFDGNGVPKVNAPASPAHDCIVNALAPTRIEPFLEAPYTIPVIVRR